MFFRLWLLFKVNYNWFPVEIPGTMDIAQHGHIFGACLKSHEDTVSCNDALHAISMAAWASSNDTYTYKPGHAIFSRLDILPFFAKLHAKRIGGFS